MIVVNYPDERLWRILVVAFPCGVGAELYGKLSNETGTMTLVFRSGFIAKDGTLQALKTTTVTSTPDRWGDARRIVLEWADRVKRLTGEHHRLEELDLSSTRTAEEQARFLKSCGHIWEPLQDEAVNKTNREDAP